MRSLIVTAIITLMTIGWADAQEKSYPLPVKAGQRFTGSASVDTLFWVLKSSQYDKAISDLKSFKASVEILEMKTGNLKAIIANKDSTIADFKVEKDRLAKKWEATNMKLEDKEVEVLKLRRWTIFSGIIGIGAGVVVGALVF